MANTDDFEPETQFLYPNHFLTANLRKPGYKQPRMKYLSLSLVILFSSASFANPSLTCYRAKGALPSSSLPETICLEMISYLPRAPKHAVVITGGNFSGSYPVVTRSVLDPLYVWIVARKNMLNHNDGTCDFSESADLILKAQAPIQGGELYTDEVNLSVDYTSRVDHCHSRPVQQLLSYELEE